MRKLYYYWKNGKYAMQLWMIAVLRSKNAHKAIKRAASRGVIID